MRCQVLSRAAVAALSLALPAALLSAPHRAHAQGTPTIPGAVPTAPTGVAPAATAGTPAGAAGAGASPAAGSAAPAAGSAAPAGSADAVDLTAPAPVVDATANPYIPVVTVRRSGLVLGVTGGLALTSASGTRQKFSLRGDKSQPGLAAGYTYEFFLGGAITDWFVFHLGGGASEATKQDLKVSAFNILFGAEVWPLFSRGGFYQNLGVGLDFGTGSASIASKSDKFDVRAEGSGFSAVRASVFYDAPLFWRVNLGPAVSYEGRFTEIYTEHLVTLGARLVYYNGP